jgi:hypothetical protein
MANTRLSFLACAVAPIGSEAVAAAQAVEVSRVRRWIMVKSPDKKVDAAGTAVPQA